MAGSTQVSLEAVVNLRARKDSLKKIVADVEEAMSNVDPSSALGKSLAPQLRKVKTILEDMEILSGSSFIDENDHKRFTRMMKSITDTISGMEARMSSRGVLSSFLLTGDEEATIARLQSEIDGIGEEMKKATAVSFEVDVTGIEEAKKLLKELKDDKTLEISDDATVSDVSKQVAEQKKLLALQKQQAEQKAAQTKQEMQAAEAEYQRYAKIEEKVYREEWDGQKRLAQKRLAESYKNGKLNTALAREMTDSYFSGGRGKAGSVEALTAMLEMMGVEPGNGKRTAGQLREILYKAYEEADEKGLSSEAISKFTEDFSDKGLEKRIAEEAGTKNYKEYSSELKKLQKEKGLTKSAYENAEQEFLRLDTLESRMTELENSLQIVMQNLQADLSARQTQVQETLKNFKETTLQKKIASMQEAAQHSQELKHDTASGQSKHDAERKADEAATLAAKQQEKEDKAFQERLTQSIKQWMGIRDVVNYAKRGLREAWQDIQGLDKAMTNIAVVTNFSVGDLWGKIDEYMDIAQQYGVTTQGVYEVSQLYYQQGLGDADTMAATTETLKMARIAGMGYQDAADGMTVAIRGFKMEMTDAAHVTDVYSKVAAVTASDTQELVAAMSKTASSAESVGSEFESTTAMLAVMIEATRESPENIGSAMKSIISRYGELTKEAKIDADGEIIDYNKVDTALKSVGISLKDSQGQFRDFDVVVEELASKWDSLDSVTQRYIATTFAGNRQQSRFLALVGNYERYAEVKEAAENAEDAGLLQYSKTLDSMETKLNNIKTNFQQFYMSIFDGEAAKGFLDFINNTLEGLNNLSSGKGFGALITSITPLFSMIRGGKMLAGGLTNTFGYPVSQMGSRNEKFKNEGLLWTKGSRERYAAAEKGQVLTGATTGVAQDKPKSFLQKLLRPQASKLQSGFLTPRTSGAPSTAQATFSGVPGVPTVNVTVNVDNSQELGSGNVQAETVQEANIQQNQTNNQQNQINSQPSRTEQISMFQDGDDTELNQDLVDEAQNPPPKPAPKEPEQLSFLQEGSMDLNPDFIVENAEIESEQAAVIPKQGGSKLASLKDNTWGTTKSGLNKGSLVSSGLAIGGGILSAVGTSVAKNNLGLGHGISMLGDAANFASIGAQFGPWGAIIGAGIGLIKGIATWPSELEIAQQKLDQAKEKAEEANLERAEKRNRANSLDAEIKKLEKLKEAQYDSEEAQQEYIDAQNSAAESFPELITGFDAMGNAIVDLTSAEALLAQARSDSAEATRKAALQELKAIDAEWDVFNSRKNRNFNGEDDRWDSISNDQFSMAEVFATEVIEDGKKTYAYHGTKSGFGVATRKYVPLNKSNSYDLANMNMGLLNSFFDLTEEQENELFDLQHSGGGTIDIFQLIEKWGRAGELSVAETLASTDKFQAWVKSSVVGFDYNSNPLLTGDQYVALMQKQMGDEKYLEATQIIGERGQGNAALLRKDELSEETAIKSGFSEQLLPYYLTDEENPLYSIAGFEDGLLEMGYENFQVAKEGQGLEEIYSTEKGKEGEFSVKAKTILNSTFEELYSSFNSLATSLSESGLLDEFSTFVEEIQEGSLSPEQIKEKLASFNLDDVNLDFANSFISSINKTREQTLENFTKLIGKEEFSGLFGEDANNPLLNENFLNKLSNNQLKALNTKIGKIRQQIQEGSLSETEAGDILKNYYNTLLDAEKVVGKERATEYRNIILEAEDLYTHSGIAETRQQLIDAGFTEIELEELGFTDFAPYVTNLVTEYGALQDRVVENLESSSEIMSKATKGMTLDEMRNLRNRNQQLTDDDFIINKDGQYVATASGRQKIRESQWQAIEETEEGLREESKRSTATLMDTSPFGEEPQYHSPTATKQWFFNKYDTFLKKDRDSLSSAAEKEFYDLLKQHYEGRQDEIKAWFDKEENQGKTWQDYWTEYFAELDDGIMSYARESLEAMTEQTELEGRQTVNEAALRTRARVRGRQGYVGEATQNIRSTGFTNLSIGDASEILSQLGIELPALGPGEEGDFVTYDEYTNTYDLNTTKILEQIDQKIAAFSGIAERTQEQEKEFQTLQAQRNMLYLGQGASLDNINANLKEGFSQLSSGLEGALTGADYTLLAQKYGVSEGRYTVEGFTLSEADQKNMLANLYIESGFVEGFGKSAWESMGGKGFLKDISSVNSEIDAIQEALADGGLSDGELIGYNFTIDEAQAYLDVLLQIRDAAMLDENAYEFNFMDQEVADGKLKNFDNFVGQIDKVKNTMASFQKGDYVDYKDFINMMEFMSKYSPDSEFSNKLKEMGVSYEDFVNSVIRNTDEWGKVDIGGVAAEMGISVDAAMSMMSEGMTDGLKEVARQQIKYLSSLEQMLKALAILEAIGNAKVGIDIEIDINGDGTPEGFENWKNLLEGIAALPEKQQKEAILKVRTQMEEQYGVDSSQLKIFDLFTGDGKIDFFEENILATLVDNGDSSKVQEILKKANLGDSWAEGVANYIAGNFKIDNLSYEDMFEIDENGMITGFSQALINMAKGTEWGDDVGGYFNHMLLSWLEGVDVSQITQSFNSLIGEKFSKVTTIAEMPVQINAQGELELILGDEQANWINADGTLNKDSFKNSNAYKLLNEQVASSGLEIDLDNTTTIEVDGKYILKPKFKQIVVEFDENNLSELLGDESGFTQIEGQDKNLLPAQFQDGYTFQGTVDGTLDYHINFTGTKVTVTMPKNFDGSEEEYIAKLQEENPALAAILGDKEHLNMETEVLNEENVVSFELGVKTNTETTVDPMLATVQEISTKLDSGISLNIDTSQVQSATEEISALNEVLAILNGYKDSNISISVSMGNEDSESSDAQAMKDQVSNGFTGNSKDYTINIKWNAEDYTSIMPPSTKTIFVDFVPRKTSGYNIPQVQWTGNMNNISGTAYANGNVGALTSGARLANKTLVGELGPELAVYGDRYHLLGQNGAEFVDLPKDALVFNHLQTAGILSGQMKNARATAIFPGSAMVNGNVSGPAAAGGIGAALAAVQRAKSVWQGLLNSLSAADLMGGGGGGGGGGNDLKAHIADLQEWYNLSRQIADIEQRINTLLAKRENISDGHKYLQNLRETQALLEDQVNTQQDLLKYQEDQLAAQAEHINNHKLWSQFLTVDENGLLQYIEGNETNGGKGALQVLDEMNKMSGEEQVAFLEKLGYTYTDNDGKELEEGELVAKFYEELQKQIDDYDALRDTVAETEGALEELETSINEIDQEIRQNEIDLSQEIYDIIVDSWKENIDNLKEQNDLIKEANDAYAQGIEEAIAREREQYDQNTAIQDREQLQRQLSLLRRSGGSASEIADLEQQLDETLKDEYFRKQEEALKNIQDANERQVKLMEQQVKMQEEALRYEQENGVIWTKVYEVLQGTDAEILAFMQGHHTKFFEQSALQQEDMLLDWAKKVGIFNEEKAYQYYQQQAQQQFNSVWETEKGKELKSVWDSLSKDEQEDLQREWYDQKYASEIVNGKSEEEAETFAQKEFFDHLEDEKKRKENNKAQTNSESGNENDNGDNGGSGKGNTKSQRKAWFINGEGPFLNKTDAISRKNRAINEQLAILSNTSRPGGLSSSEAKKAQEIINKWYASVPEYKAYAKGGIIDFTGPAWVDGSKSEPERILTGEQNQILEEGLAMNAGRGNALKEALIAFATSQMSSIREVFSRISSSMQSQAISIAPGAVVVHVDELANGYDVDELYNDITEKLYSIASKSSSRGVNRR